MKKSSLVFKAINTAALCTVAASGVTAAVIYANSKNINDTDQKKDQNITSSITWDNQYVLGTNDWDDFTKFVENPSEENIRVELNKQFPDAFPILNDFDLIINSISKTAEVRAKTYSNIYSGTTTVAWDVEQKIALPSHVLISQFFTGSEIYENKDITDKMVFDKLVKEYSTSLNINQLQISNKDIAKGEFYVTPKANSTVYDSGSVLAAQINVSNSAVLTYGATVLTPGSDSGNPTFTYRGTTITSGVTYSILGSTPSSPISWSSNKLSYASGIEYNGGIYVIQGSYTDNGTVYTAQWTIFCQVYKKPTNVFNFVTNAGSAGDNAYKLWDFTESMYDKYYSFSVVSDLGYINGKVTITVGTESDKTVVTGFTEYFSWYGMSGKEFFVGVIQTSSNPRKYQLWFGTTTTDWFRPNIQVQASYANSSANITPNPTSPIYGQKFSTLSFTKVKKFGVNI